MSIIIENEYEGEINIPYEKIAHEVIEAAIDYVDCPYECEVNLMLTDNETIHAINKEQREIDRPTDVLSFPMAEYEEPADFSKIEEDPMAFDPESGEFLLGDIVISMDKVWEQAENYGYIWWCQRLFRIKSWYDCISLYSSGSYFYGCDPNDLKERFHS